MTEKASPNAHIQAFLNYYVSVEEHPGYAVLLNGPWGVGKTFLIRKFLEARDPSSGKQGSTYIFLSLYGISSALELRRELFAAAYPALTGKAAQLTGSITKSLLSIVNFSSDLKLEDLRPLPKDKIIVVDDIERCAMPVTEALGFLNALVEQDGYKLVLLGNEEEIAEAERKKYQRTREKLIGQVLTVKPDIPGAYDYFISKLRTPDGRNFFETHKERVLTLYTQSGIQNLRALQQVIGQFERLLEALPAAYAGNQAGITAVLDLILVIGLEYQTGCIDRTHIDNRVTGLLHAVRELNRRRQSENREEPDPFDKLQAKYIGLDLRSTVLSNPTLVQLLADGHIDTEAICTDLGQSEYFAELQPEEAWRTVWYGVKRTEDVFVAAKDELIRAFNAREYRDPGIILHVIMLRLWLADMDYLEEDTKELVAQAKVYIDDVFAVGAFSVREPRRRIHQDTVHSHSLGFHGKETPEFKEIVRYLEARIAKAYEDSRKSWANSLLETLKRNAQQFAQQVTFSEYGQNYYWREPVLHLIDPALYIDTALQLDPQGQDIAFLALSERYKDNALEEDLLPEKDWACRVRALLAARAQASTGITRYKFNLFDRWYFAPTLD